jgi:methylmalonyl-CoA/ethylmalonyl-CoA epimerase
LCFFVAIEKNSPPHAGLTAPFPAGIIAGERRSAMLEYVHHVAYAVDDMDAAVAVFRDLFELEMTERREVRGERSFEMATFRCGPTIIELQRPIDYPELAQYIADNGPGLNHVAFAVRDLPGKVEKLRERGVSFVDPGAFVAGTGWRIANFDLAGGSLPLFQSRYHDDHLAEAE